MRCFAAAALYNAAVCRGLQRCRSCGRFKPSERLSSLKTSPPAPSALCNTDVLSAAAREPRSLAARYCKLHTETTLAADKLAADWRCQAIRLKNWPKRSQNPRQEVLPFMFSEPFGLQAEQISLYCAVFRSRLKVKAPCFSGNRT